MNAFEILCDEILALNDSYLAHYGRSKKDGALYGSGRYPLGSGENPYQHELDFYNQVQKMVRTINPETGKKYTYTEIAKSMNMTTTEFRPALANASALYRMDVANRAKDLREKGYSYRAIGENVNMSEAGVRKLLSGEKPRVNKNQEIADKIADYIDTYGMVDLTKGTELALGCSETRLKNAMALLEEQGYKRHEVRVDQLGNSDYHKTIVVTYTKDDVEYKDVLANKDKIRSIGADGAIIDTDGVRLLGMSMDPVSVNSDRVMIRYKEDGGEDKDGVIELRRGCEDLNLGKASYAQTRIAVDGKYFLKGVARYADDESELPPGVDIIYNVNKSREKGKFGVMKEMEPNPANPFKSSIKDEDDLTLIQKYYFDSEGNKKKSALNIVNEEGTWDTWSKNLPSQVWSKQSEKLAKRQLDLALASDTAELDDILALNNPVVKRKLLEDYSDQADAKARDLKAAPFPGQRTRLLAPIPDMPDGQCYCSDYPNGTKLYLIRFPHGTIAEIPEVVVNNNHPNAKKILGNAPDAIGINHNTAAQMSGADYDGDTCLCIPQSSSVRLRTKKPYQELVEFDPMDYEYTGAKAGKKNNPKHVAIQMGVVTNLITDMTMKGAPDEDIVRAVKCSMVIIDAKKKPIDYTRAFREMGMAQLQKKWQYDEEKGKAGGASTLISRAKNEVDVPERKTRTGIYFTNSDPETGEKIWTETGRTKTVKSVKTVKDKETGESHEVVTVKEGVQRTQKSTRMDEAKDARELSSGYLIEEIAANYANGEKALAKKARKEYLRSVKEDEFKRDPQAAKTYAAEVESLNKKLLVAKQNAPYERQAIILGNSLVESAIRENPDMSKEDRKKLRGRSLVQARTALGTKKQRVNFTDKEWEAIQHRAVSASVLEQLLRNADMDDVRQRATPRSSKTSLMPSQLSLIRQMGKGGYSNAEIADRLGVSTSTISSVLNGSYTAA